MAQTDKSRNSTDFLTPILQAWNVADGKLVRSVSLGKSGGLSSNPIIDSEGDNLLVPLATYGQIRPQDDTVEVRDFQTGAVKDTLRTGETFNRVTALSPDGSRALAIPYSEQDFSGHRAQIWDVKTKQALQVLADEKISFTYAKFSFDGSKILVADQAGAIDIFDSATGQREHHLSGAHCSRVTTLQMTPDNQTLLSQGEGGGRFNFGI